MSDIHLDNTYAHPIDQVWSARTEPDLIAQWTVTGQAARAIDFSTAVGTRFRYVSKPTIGWDGTVYCEVLACEAPSLFRYSWRGDEHGHGTEVSYHLGAISDRETRFVYDHTGFRGLGGA